ncbi:MAG: hypothetical protein GC147_02105 [Porphyrobacter sp.]|nr:hypothetical protein [Porphyrobacter sp.]
MPIRLAPAHDPARTAGRHAAGRGLVSRVRIMAANDNGDGVAAGTAGAFDPLLVDALRHFARHGLDAARVAQGEAERAALAGDAPGAAHWIAITGLFDRRLAAAASPLPVLA